MATKKMTVAAASIPVLIVLGVCSYMAFSAFVSGRETADYACALSVADAILNSDNENTRSGIKAGPEWRLLDNTEVADLLNSIDESKSLDCFRLLFRPDGRSKPPKNLEIWVRRESGQSLQISVKIPR